MRILYYILIITLFSYSDLLAQQWQSNGNNIYNTNTGNVGIGTSSPSRKLEVVGDIKVSEDIYVNYTTYSGGSTGNGVGNLILFGDGANGGGWQSSIRWSGMDGFSPNGGSRTNAEITIDGLATYGRADLVFKTKGSSDGAMPTEKLRITKDGNVGIGTTTPDATLAVNGDIHTQEVRVDMTGWPDFVFKKDYSLPALDEVENHIKVNGHLKDIPSEAEVKTNGINLGEMDAKLLQKIEELTLYIIDLQKQINELKQQHKNK